MQKTTGAWKGGRKRGKWNAKGKKTEAIAENRSTQANQNGPSFPIAPDGR